MPRNSVVVTVLFINVILIVAMIVVIAFQISGLWRAWREKVAGSRLHVRIVALFSVIAALPAIILAVAATTTFSRSLDGWFSTRTRQIIENSIDVANAYLEEHGQVIRTDIVNMGKDLAERCATIGGDPEKLKSLVFIQAGLRDLPVRLCHRRRGQAHRVGPQGQQDRLPAAAAKRHPTRSPRPDPAADADATPTASQPSRSSMAIQAPICSSRAVSALRCWATCNEPRQASTNTNNCAADAAVSRPLMR